MSINCGDTRVPLLFPVLHHFEVEAGLAGDGCLHADRIHC